MYLLESIFCGVPETYGKYIYICISVGLNVTNGKLTVLLSSIQLKICIVPTANK